MVEMHPTHQRVVVVETALQRLASSGIFGRIRVKAMSANTAGSRSPAINASSIRRGDTPVTSVASDDNLIPASSNNFWMR